MENAVILNHSVFYAVVLGKADVLGNLFSQYSASVDAYGCTFWTRRWVTHIRAAIANNFPIFTSRCTLSEIKLCSLLCLQGLDGSPYYYRLLKQQIPHSSEVIL